MTRRAAPPTLPPLDAEQQAQGQRVLSMLQQAIVAAGGWLSFADYMQRTLYAPGLGYYSAGATKFGSAGDFVTAPEISPLFAPLVARSIGDVLGHLAAGGALQAPGGSVLEFGAGTGRFASGTLDALKANNVPFRQYQILEVSGDLRQRQQGSLAQRGGATVGATQWLQRLPDAFDGVIFANEVLDALATERFVMRAGRPRRLGVRLDGQRLQWAEREPDDLASASVEATIAVRLGHLASHLPDGYVSECCLGIEPWIAALSVALRQGVVLLIDYGLPREQLYHPQRQAGTLRCYFRHRAHDDPFFHPGLCDITAWVDIDAVADAAQRHDLALLGCTTQAAFLLENGIESLLARDMPDQERATLAHGARQLLLPGEMGESVKVIALGRNYGGPLSGFSLQDLTARV